MLYLAGIFRTSSLGGSISQNPEKTVPRRQGTTTDYTDVYSKWQVVPNLKRLKENQMSG